MSMEYVPEHAPLQDMTDPVLVTAFASQVKGGQTATSALAYALGQWDAKLFAELDSDGYYIDGEMRPWVRRDGDKTVIDWPQNLVYRIDASERTVLVLVGVEPNMNWRGFVADIAGFAERHNVSLAVNLKAVPATVPHTLQAPLKAIYSDAALQAQFGIEELDDQQGPADIGRVLNLQLASRGIPAVDVYAMEPFYASAIPDAEAGIGLLRALERTFDLPIDTDRLEQTAAAQRQAIDAVVEKSDQLRETVQALEQRARSAALLAAPEAPDTALDASAVVDEAEAFLRSLRADDDTAA
jgi:predicted ATP-grasp superfamily ATP-dependent carboligase